MMRQKRTGCFLSASLATRFTPTPLVRLGSIIIFSYSLAFLSQTNNAANRPDDGGVPIERHGGSSSRQKNSIDPPNPKKMFHLRVY